MLGQNKWNALGATVGLVVLASMSGCDADGDEGGAGMAARSEPKSLKVVTGDPVLIQKLQTGSKLSLIEGIEQSEKLTVESGGGAATSAKFELEKTESRDLVLSVYTVPEARDNPNVLAEKATMVEVVARADTGAWGARHVFEDAEHLLRSAVHLALWQQSKRNFADLIRAANKAVDGMPFYAKNPQVRDGVPLVDVQILGTDGIVRQISINIVTGEAI